MSDFTVKLNEKPVKETVVEADKVIVVDSEDSNKLKTTPALAFTGPQGEPGGAGPQGEPGAQGAPGAYFLKGEGSPSDEYTGEDGDVYLDTVTNELHGPKADGAWPAAPFGAVVPAGGLQGQFLVKGDLKLEYETIYEPIIDRLEDGGNIDVALSDGMYCLKGFGAAVCGLKLDFNVIVKVTDGVAELLDATTVESFRAEYVDEATLISIDVFEDKFRVTFVNEEYGAVAWAVKIDGIMI